MIIDLILDRNGGTPYKAKDFYNYVCEEEDIFEFEHDISRALDSGSENDVRKALCDYVINNDYNPKICNYINRVNWLEDDITDDELNDSFMIIDDYEKFLDNEKVQNMVVSNKYLRKQIISILEEFVKEIEDTIDSYKQLDKELKL